MNPGSCPLKCCLHSGLGGADGLAELLFWTAESVMTLSRCHGYTNGNKGGMHGVLVRQPHQNTSFCSRLEECRWTAANALLYTPWPA